VSLPIAFEDEEEKATAIAAATVKFVEEDSEQTTSHTACDVEEPCNEHVVTAEVVKPTAAESNPTGLQMSLRASAENNADIRETDSDVILGSESERLGSREYCFPSTSGGQTEHRDIDNKEPHGAHPQEKSAERNEEVQVGLRLSSSEKQKDESEEDVDCNETAFDGSPLVAAADLERTDDGDKMLTTDIAAEKQSMSAEESDSLEVPLATKSQSECSNSQPVEPKANGNSLDKIPFTDYIATVGNAKERLKTTSEKPESKNSLLNSFRFYTREEHLDEYFCTTCNEGIFSISCRKRFAVLLVATFVLVEKSRVITLRFVWSCDGCI